LATIDAVAALNPTIIVAGHKDPDAPDDDAARQLAQSRDYVTAFDEAVSKSSSAQDIITDMTSRFPNYGNPYTLFVSAHSQYGA
jgi:hypothetical protein